jgi:cytidylate kinase
MIIAIDGPSGSGKSTVARMVAERLGFLYIDSGAIYRALALAALDAGAPLEDADALDRVAAASEVRLEPAPDGVQVWLDGRDVSAPIRTPRVTAAVSRVAVVPEVRDRVTALVRAQASGRDVVTDGRDTTTVIFPAAELKVFLDASAEERARRRTLDLETRGTPQPFAEVLAAIEERDRRDSGRAVGALRRAPDALVVETTDMGLDDVVDRVADAARHVQTGR